MNDSVKHLSIYWPQLVTPLNLGTFVFVNAVGLGWTGGVTVADVDWPGCRNFIASISSCNCAATVSIKSACCGLRKSYTGSVPVLGGGLSYLSTGVGRVVSLYMNRSITGCVSDYGGSLVVHPWTGRLPAVFQPSVAAQGWQRRQFIHEPVGYRLCSGPRWRPAMPWGWQHR